MSSYCITAAKPKGATSHLNSQFKTWKGLPDGRWEFHEWLTTSQIVALMHVGHDVFTAEEEPNSIAIGAPVEVELRISHNQQNYPISKMPDR